MGSDWFILPHLNVQVESTTGGRGKAELNIPVFSVVPVVCFS